MTRVSKDVGATILVALAVLVFFATHQGWGVTLVRDSHRWAAGVVALSTIRHTHARHRPVVT